MNIHFVLHESFESPAAIKTWAEQKGHHITATRVYEKESLPSDAKNIDFLVIMGGPQSPATTIAECPYFDAAQEISLIQSAIEYKRLILGVCLGAQLIGEAYGARFAKSTFREVGVFPIELTEAAHTDPIFSQFPKLFNVGQWHADMPGILSESHVLAKSKGCPRQIVKYDERVYGFQCQFQFTKQSVEAMIANCPQDLEPGTFIQSSADLRNNNYDEMNKLLFRFLDYMESLHIKR